MKVEKIPLCELEKLASITNKSANCFLQKNGKKIFAKKEAAGK